MQVIKEYSGIKVTMNDVDFSKIGVIYLLEFPNKKVYVGQTNNDIRLRMSHHCHKGNGCTKLDRAIQKYREVVVNVLSSGLSQDQLNTYEYFFIKAYDSILSGYNLKDGGSRGKHSPESIEKMSNAKKGHKLSDEGKSKISKAHKGKVISEETKRKTTETCATKRQANPVYKNKTSYVDIATGVEYDTMRELANVYGITRQAVEQELKRKRSRFLKIVKSVNIKAY